MAFQTPSLSFLLTSNQFVHANLMQGIFLHKPYRALFKTLFCWNWYDTKEIPSMSRRSVTVQYQSLLRCYFKVVSWCFAALGLGISVIAPLGLALVGRISPPDQRVKAISNVALIGYTGFFIGPPLMGGLSELASLATSFGALSLLLASVALALIPMLAGSLKKDWLHPIAPKTLWD